MEREQETVDIPELEPISDTQGEEVTDPEEWRPNITPRMRMVYEMRKEMKPEDIALQLRITQSAVYGLLNRCRQAGMDVPSRLSKTAKPRRRNFLRGPLGGLGKLPPETDNGMPRCPCGLLLPCVHVPLEYYATAKRQLIQPVPFLGV